MWKHGRRGCKRIMCGMVLAKHYDFAAEEVDVIANYDSKHRMGRNGGEED